jgi:hypothetical protein
MNILALSELGFWWLIAPFILLVILDAWGSNVLNFVVVLISGVLLQYFGQVDFVGMFHENSWNLAIVAGLYLAAGAVYSVFKWRLYTHSDEVAKELKEKFGRFQQNYYVKFVEDGGKTVSGVPTTKPVVDETISLAEKLTAFKANNQYNFLTPLENKSRIMFWMVWWVPNSIWTIMDDFVMEIWNKIYNLFSKVYESISNSAIDKAVK